MTNATMKAGGGAILIKGLLREEKCYHDESGPIYREEGLYLSRVHSGRRNVTIKTEGAYAILVKSYRCYTDIADMLQGYYKHITSFTLISQICYMEITGMLQTCYIELTSFTQILQICYKGITRMVHTCFMNASAKRDNISDQSVRGGDHSAEIVTFSAALRPYMQSDTLQVTCRFNCFNLRC